VDSSFIDPQARVLNYCSSNKSNQQSIILKLRKIVKKNSIFGCYNLF